MSEILDWLYLLLNNYADHISALVCVTGVLCALLNGRCNEKHQFRVWILGVIFIVISAFLFSKFSDLRQELSDLIDESVWYFIILVSSVIFISFLIFSFILRENERFKSEIRILSVFFTVVSVLLFGIEKQELQFGDRVNELRSEYVYTKYKYDRIIDSYLENSCSRLNIDHGSTQSMNKFARESVGCSILNEYKNRLPDEISRYRDDSSIAPIPGSLYKFTSGTELSGALTELNLIIYRIPNVVQSYEENFRKVKAREVYTRLFLWVVFLFCAAAGLEIANEYRKNSAWLMHLLRLRRAKN